MGISGHEQHVVFVPSISEAATTFEYHASIVKALYQRRSVLENALLHLIERAPLLTEVAVRLVETLRNGHKVLVMGNGGSAAEAQHFAAELVGRFKRDRAPYAVLSLTTDTSILTSVANDYGYQDVFARQVRAFGKADDMLFAFSTSGESENMISAAQAGRERCMTVVAVTGDRPSSLGMLSDIAVRMPVVDTATVQELHMMMTHILCEIVESQLADCEGEVK